MVSFKVECIDQRGNGRKDGLVPCSDMAGEVIDVGEDVTTWKKGDRVCANFSTEYLFGQTSAQIIQSSLGGETNGVLTQYRNFPAHASLLLFEIGFRQDDIVFSRLWLFHNISTLTRLRLFREYFYC